MCCLFKIFVQSVWPQTLLSMNHIRVCDCTAFQITCDLGESLGQKLSICCIIHETDISIRCLVHLFTYLDVKIMYLKIDIKHLFVKMSFIYNPYIHVNIYHIKILYK